MAHLRKTGECPAPGGPDPQSKPLIPQKAPRRHPPKKARKADRGVRPSHLGRFALDRQNHKIKLAAGLLPEMAELVGKIHEGEGRVVKETSLLDAWRGLAGASFWTPQMVRVVRRLVG
jgi:hypothetical protein